jgi:hypothetical protein
MRENKDWKKRYPIQIGKRGEDDYFLKCANGEITTWEEYDVLQKELGLEGNKTIPPTKE